MAKYIDLEKGGNVLDIGCGTGHFLMQFNEKWKKYGIEVSDSTIFGISDNGVLGSGTLPAN